VGNLTNVSVRAVTVACALGTTTDQIEEVATGASGLLSQGNGNYQYNWATPKGYARSCKQMTLDLGEGGLTHNAYFQFLR
jgi:hypothetical protein